MELDSLSSSLIFWGLKKESIGYFRGRSNYLIIGGGLFLRFALIGGGLLFHIRGGLLFILKNRIFHIGGGLLLGFALIGGGL
jgi:hypothetical protein